MFKPSRPLYRSLRRLALTTKQVNGGYYKGNRTGSIGSHTKWGGYRIDWKKVRTHVVPTSFETFEVGSAINLLLKNGNSSTEQLTPFVTRRVEISKGNFKGDPKGGLSGKLYLEQWERENGTD